MASIVDRVISLEHDDAGPHWISLDHGDVGHVWFTVKHDNGGLPESPCSPTSV
jgi:hypothetical protein